jgi:hypothetical protein
MWIEMCWKKQSTGPIAKGCKKSMKVGRSNMYFWTLHILIPLSPFHVNTVLMAWEHNLASAERGQKHKWTKSHMASTFTVPFLCYQRIKINFCWTFVHIMTSNLNMLWKYVNQTFLRIMTPILDSHHSALWGHEPLKYDETVDCTIKFVFRNITKKFSLMQFEMWVNQWNVFR